MQIYPKINKNCSQIRWLPKISDVQILDIKFRTKNSVFGKISEKKFWTMNCQSSSVFLLILTILSNWQHLLLLRTTFENVPTKITWNWNSINHSFTGKKCHFFPEINLMNNMIDSIEVKKGHVYLNFFQNKILQITWQKISSESLYKLPKTVCASDEFVCCLFVFLCNRIYSYSRKYEFAIVSLLLIIFINYKSTKMGTAIIERWMISINFFV